MNGTIKANERITEHFLYRELACPCCEGLKIVPGLFRHMELLEKLRQEAGFRMVVNSGHRCPIHNKAVGGVAKSWHLLFATDVRPEDGDPENLERMRLIAKLMPWGGIGIYGTFMHLDLRPDKTVWWG